MGRLATVLVPQGVRTTVEPSEKRAGSTGNKLADSEVTERGLEGTLKETDPAAAAAAG
jgi:hypothetical protein